MNHEISLLNSRSHKPSLNLLPKFPSRDLLQPSRHPLLPNSIPRRKNEKHTGANRSWIIERQPHNPAAWEEWITSGESADGFSLSLSLSLPSESGLICLLIFHNARRSLWGFVLARACALVVFALSYLGERERALRAYMLIRSGVLLPNGN